MKSMDELQSEFDQTALRLEARERKHPNKNIQHSRMSMLEHLPSPCIEGLDIGCGLGDFARLLAPRCQNVLALDLSPEMIRIARERSGEFSNIEYAVMDVMKWDFPVQRFDCVASFITLHHLPLEEILTKMKAGLKPGGLLLVVDMYQASGWRHTVVKALKEIRHQFRRLNPRRKALSGTFPWQHDPDEKYMTINEIREIYQRVLPGVTVKELFIRKRYSVIWKKPV
jgi:ubiquinone/menaquinone biosynthesis C-methylase UbiE